MLRLCVNDDVIVEIDGIISGELGSCGGEDKLDKRSMNCCWFGRVVGGATDGGEEMGEAIDEGEEEELGRESTLSGGDSGGVVNPGYSSMATPVQLVEFIVLLPSKLPIPRISMVEQETKQEMEEVWLINKKNLSLSPLPSTPPSPHQPLTRVAGLPSGRLRSGNWISFQISSLEQSCLIRSSSITS